MCNLDIEGSRKLSIVEVGAIGCITSFTALLGISFTLFIKKPSERLKEACTFLAAGIMVAASLDMVLEAYHLSIQTTVLGFFSGWLFVKVS